MKKYLFLILLVFFITVIVLGNYVMSVRTTLKDQSLNSKTKESFEIYTSNNILNTEEKLTENNTLAIENLEQINQSSSETSNEDSVQSSSENSQDIKIADSKENLVQNQIPETNENSNKEENSTQNIINEEVVNEEISNSITPSYEQSQIIRSNYGFLILPEQVPLEILQTAESEINKLPPNVVNAFSSNGWTINITNENIASKYFGGAYSNVLGATKTDSKQIIIQNKKSCVRESVVHEMGHFVDWYFDFPSLSDEFWEIYNQEVDTFKSRISNSSSVRNEMEFFAHTFYYLIKDPSKCTPMATQYVQNYINNI